MFVVSFRSGLDDVSTEELTGGGVFSLSLNAVVVHP